VVFTEASNNRQSVKADLPANYVGKKSILPNQLSEAWSQAEVWSRRESNAFEQGSKLERILCLLDNYVNR
jgi:hypothetical protein